MIYEQQVTLKTGVMMLKIQQFIERMRLRRQKVQLFCRDQKGLIPSGSHSVAAKAENRDPQPFITTTCKTKNKEK